MPRGKKEKQESEPVEELKDAAEEVTVAVAVAVAVEEPEPEEPIVAEDDDDKAAKKGVGRKRKAEEEPEREPEEDGDEIKEEKRNKTNDAELLAAALAGDDANVNTALVLPSKEGQDAFTELDVLLGRGGGTVSACIVLWRGNDEILAAKIVAWLALGAASLTTLSLLLLSLKLPEFGARKSKLS